MNQMNQTKDTTNKESTPLSNTGKPRRKWKRPPQLYKPGQSGNPTGKPKGTKNRFTLLKQSFVKAYDKANAEGRLQEFLEKGSSNDFFKAMEIVCKVLPSGPVVDQSEHTHITYVWAGRKKENGHTETENENSQGDVRAARVSVDQPRVES